MKYVQEMVMSYSGERELTAPHMALVPMVVEQTFAESVSYDIYRACLKSALFF